jgi:hypothetical protein
LDQRERYEDHQEAFRAAMDGRQAQIWTSTPAIVESFDGNTLRAKPAIQEKVRAKDGTVSDVNLPLLIYCPVVFPTGGGYVLTFPIKPGDEVLIVFASRCIDNWWKQGGVQKQAEMRMHDISDGFAIPGPLSDPRKVSNVSTTATVLRSMDNLLNVTLDSSIQKILINATNQIDLTATTQVTVTAPTIIAHASTALEVDSPVVTINASSQVAINSPNLLCSGGIIAQGGIVAYGDVWAGGPSGTELAGHAHTGVQSGTSTSGPPIPGS